MINRMIQKLIPTLLLCMGFVFLTGCTKKIYDVVYPTLNDGRYDSEFPYRNASEQLEEISKSVKMLNYIAYYKAYLFSENQNVMQSDINNKEIKDKSIEEFYFNETVSGTATIVFYDDLKVGLLTCAHIGDFPDTVLTYYEPLSGQKNQIIKHMSTKIREHYFINEIPGEGDFEIVVRDTKRDLALLTKKTLNDPFQRIKPFKYPLGESSNLELGSFVYIIGYPMGHKMITKGIVSNTRDNKGDSFLIDALFNRGFSGGIILAIKDGVPNFELVGIAKSVSANNQYILTPAPLNGKLEYEPNFPYSGDAQVKKFEDINYGITFTISTDEIIKFFNENEAILLQKGFNFNYLTK
ncbi:trypsin-like peptidase domain-containing protein [Candidatus Neomarinimicrobiota bacterium]